VTDQPWVLLDTDVWSWLYGRKKRTHPEATRWRAALTGRSIVISTQTRAEVLTWLAQGELGPERAGAIEGQLNRTRTVPVTEDVVRAYARLTAECRRRALGLHDKKHTGDRWVAATAIAIDAPLLTLDGIFHNAPGLQVLASS